MGILFTIALVIQLTISTLSCVPNLSRLASVDTAQGVFAAPGDFRGAHSSVIRFPEISVLFVITP